MNRKMMKAHTINIQMVQSYNITKRKFLSMFRSNFLSFPKNQPDPVKNSPIYKRYIPDRSHKTISKISDKQTNTHTDEVNISVNEDLY